MCKRLRLGRYLRHPGDGRVRAQIPAQDLLWAQIAGQMLRESTFHGIEALVRSLARRALAVARSFGDDALAYFTERLDAGPTRQALVSLARQAKRNKAFECSRFIGLAVDGTGAGWSEERRCSLCRPLYGPQREVTGHGHHLSHISVVGAGLTLPLDVEPSGPGDSELGASRRLLPRAVGLLGRRFADYVVADAEYANAPFLHDVGDLGLRAIVRLKENLPELYAAARARWERLPPSRIFEEKGNRVEMWDADDFDAWEELRWTTVRVVRYRQYKRDGTVAEAYWLTDFPSRQVGTQSLYRLAKSRWEIENQGFNDAKNRHGLEHVPHHHANSLVIGWLLTFLALAIERLYRIRYLHRGTHPVLTGIELVRRLWLGLASPRPRDSS